MFNKLFKKKKQEEEKTSPAPNISWIRVCKMLSNIPYGTEPDLNQWGIPLIKPQQADTPNPELTKRLLTAFDKAMAEGGEAGDGLWKTVRTMFHGPILDIIQSKNIDALSNELAGMFFSPVATGLCARHADENLASKDPMTRLQIVDAINSLAMALNVRSVPNPASKDEVNVFTLDTEETLDLIQGRLGWDIHPPQAGGIAGIEYKSGVIPLKYFFQIYAAQRMVSIFDGPIDSCVEIGGGVGFLSYMCIKNNLVKDYTIIDLPLVNMLQGYLLLNSPVADQVVLFGEEDNTAPEKPTLRIMPNFHIEQMAEKSVDIAFNQDSFPEMGHATMENYFTHIERIVKSYLLSINHESAQQVTGSFSHGLVGLTLEKYDNFKRIYRMPYWMRPGYVEELFKIEN